MHDASCFVTLTYSDEHLGHPRLNYEEFQLFMKKFRKLSPDPMGFVVCGEYGELRKRKHWHVLVFGFRPLDGKYRYTSKLGHKFYTSEVLDRTWGRGVCDFSDLTVDSANYVCRYATKKLVHGRDGEHEFNPIFKQSSKYAIGRKYIEKYWPDVFNSGRCTLADGSSASIPRYYVKWFAEHYPAEHIRYVTGVKARASEIAAYKASLVAADYHDANVLRSDRARAASELYVPMVSRLEVLRLIAKSNFNTLRNFLKLK